MRKIYVSIGIDCDPDRDTYPEKLTFRGIENIPSLFKIEGVKWTFNIRADTQIRDYLGSADYCYHRYRQIWDLAETHGSALAWHLHYFDKNGRQDTSESNILENIQLGSEALKKPDVVHMGWTFQNEFSIGKLYDAGVKIDYSPLPRMRFSGRNGVDRYDWSTFAYRPQYWRGVKMIPAYTFRNRVLARRFRSERVMLTICTDSRLYRMLLRDFFKSGSDFFVAYFHSDEIASALPHWRKTLYSFKNLKNNIQILRKMAERSQYEIQFLNIRELAEILFDEHNPGNK